MTTPATEKAGPVGSSSEEPAGAASPLRNAALRYARRGWPVFPLEPGGKRPVIPSAHPQGDPLRGVCHGECGREGHGLYDAVLDPDTIKRWWTCWPTANIGLRTGIAFDVLDVDTKHGDGWHTLANVVAEHGCLPSSPCSATPSGGMHYLFAPTGLGNKAGFRPDLDWRGKGGYIVAPPSVRTDGKYKWAVTPKEQEIMPAPAWLRQLLEHKEPAQRVLSAGAGGTTAYGRAALEREIGKLIMAPEGERNHQLFKCSANFGELVAGRELDRDEAISNLLLTADRIGLDDDEIDATIASGMNTGLRSPRRAP